MIDRLVVLSIANLRPADLRDPHLTPHLHQMAIHGDMRTLAPSFPAVSRCVQASVLTGRPSAEHGLCSSANATRQPFSNNTHSAQPVTATPLVPDLFTTLAKQKPRSSSAAWFTAFDVPATYSIRPTEIHAANGGFQGTFSSRPAGWEDVLHDALGEFPWDSYWGPRANAHCTKWILDGILHLAARHAPHFQFAHLPHLSFAAQQYGPDSSEASRAIAEMDRMLAQMMEQYGRLKVGKQTAWIIFGEYVITSVSGTIHPNRILRHAALLSVRKTRQGEQLDLPHSTAFAVVDRQIAYVYVRNGDPHAIAETFLKHEEIADVLVGSERRAVGMDRPEIAPIILIARPDRWFHHAWWSKDSLAPRAMHSWLAPEKWGYDPLELLVDPYSGNLPMNPSLIHGSHGAPCVDAAQQTMLIASDPALLRSLPTPTHDYDLFPILARVLNLG